MVGEKLSQGLQNVEIWKPICGSTVPTLGVVDYCLQSGNVFCIGAIGGGGEEKVNYLEERVGRVVEVGEGNTRWRVG